jgi:hypothetical protein
MDVVKALQQHSEAGAAIVDLLYGDAGEEVAKALIEFGKEDEKSDKVKRIGQVSNAVGLAAGLAATPGAIAEVGPAYRKATGQPKSKTPSMQSRLKKIGRTQGGFAGGAARAGHKALKTLKKPKVALGLAAGGAALQVGNVAGDALVSQLLKDKKTEPKKPPQNFGKSVDFDIYTEISKVDTEKRQVFGWASVTKSGGVDVVDLQGDVIPLEEIEKAAYEFVKKSRVGGKMHAKGDAGPIHVSDMIESFVVTPEKKAAMGLPDETPEGWWVGFKVNDDDTWAEAKDGKLAGFSVHGSGRRVPTDA